MPDFKPTPEGVSPRPWRVDEKGFLVDANGDRIATGYDLDDADHIAHVVSNWDALVTAAEIERAELREALTRLTRALDPTDDDVIDDFVDDRDSAHEALDDALALLARTGGGE